MLMLAIANLTHRKVRSGLSILAVAISITLLLVLVGLSRGTLDEVSARMEGVEAEIVVKDKHFDLGSMSGGKLWEKEIPRIAEAEVNDERVVERVIPVFLGRMKLGGLSQNVFGVKPEDFGYFAGARRMITGGVFGDIESSAMEIEKLEQNGGESRENPPLNLVIDQRLSEAGTLKAGDAVTYGDYPARIVGVVETGVAGRVFAPINMLRAVNGISASTAHMFFVKARPGLTADQLRQLCEGIEQKTGRQAILVSSFGQALAENFRSLEIFVNLVSVISLVICFLFIVVTMYTIVLERGKEIAILQSLGASKTMVLRQTMQESLLICTLGTATGILLAMGVKWLIETIQPLMTIEMRMTWTGLAVLIGIAGGVISALYPSYLALRHDPVEALSFE